MYIIQNRAGYRIAIQHHLPFRVLRVPAGRIIRFIWRRMGKISVTGMRFVYLAR